MLVTGWESRESFQEFIEIVMGVGLALHWLSEHLAKVTLVIGSIF